MSHRSHGLPTEQHNQLVLPQADVPHCTLSAPGTATSPSPSKLKGKSAASPVPPASLGNNRRVGPTCR